MISRILAVTHARNIEFLRDRSVLTWNLVLPIMLALGLSMVFSGPERAQYKVAVVAAAEPASVTAHPFLDIRFIDFYDIVNAEDVVDKLIHHQVDLIVDPATVPLRYWVNDQSRNGYLVEKLLLGSDAQARSQIVSGEAIRYIDWLFPGIVAMNLMFSCLFGVGYVVVRYRKNGFLKRLSATPLRAFEFVSAQILSRLMLVVVTTGLIFLIAGSLLDIRMQGSYWLLTLTLLLGASSLISVGFLISARVTSEELAGGLLNLLSWPMMVLCGVWFTMEGRASWLQSISDLFPLTHLLKAMRGIMLDGQGFAQVSLHLLILLATTVIFLVIGSWLFRWRER